MKKIIFVITLLLVISCTTKSKTTFQEMNSDSLITKFFTKEEIGDLTLIIDFFEEEICKNFDKGDKSNVKKCYDAFIKRDSTNKVEGSLTKFIDYKKQKALYAKIDSVFFKLLWVKSKATFFDKETEFEYEYFHLKLFDEDGFSNYSKFIKEYSNENQYLKEYYESVEVVNDFSSPSSILLVSLYHKLDKNDIKIRLIYAFHYLNINEVYINPRDRLINKIKQQK